MSVSEVATRYSRALFDVAEEQNEQDLLFGELRKLAEDWKQNKVISDFFSSPLVPAQQKEGFLKKAFEGSKISPNLAHFICLLARKGRLEFFNDIVEAYQKRTDEAHGVCRGTVRSAVVLSGTDREKVEDIVQERTGKKVILNYLVDPDLIGGMVAQVGSFKFDDGINSHLHRLKNNLQAV